jgi:hypothetical protein
MKQKPKAHLMIVSVIITLLMTVPVLSCTTQVVSEAELEAPDPPAASPAASEAPDLPAVPSSPAETNNPTPPEITEPETPTEINRVNVVYFHRTNRCHSCTYAEEQIRYTLESYFSDEMESGMVTFQSVDVQNPDNSEIIEKCGAYTSQLFIITITGDSEHIKHVEEIWKLIGKDEDFSNLVEDKITDALEWTG